MLLLLIGELTDINDTGAQASYLEFSIETID